MSTGLESLIRLNESAEAERPKVPLGGIVFVGRSGWPKRGELFVTEQGNLCVATSDWPELPQHVRTILDRWNENKSS